MTILMSPPTHFDVTYQINPWMKQLGTVAANTAAQQWQSLEHTIKEYATVVEAEPAAHPDFVFTANAGLVRGREVILSSFKYAERQVEEPYWQQLFASHGYTTHTLDQVAFEGAGDALFAGRLLIGGYGFRTDQAAYDQIAKLWDIDILRAELIDPRFYHLDTCLCVLDAQTILYYPPAFVPEARTALEERFDTIHVCEAEALQFACNAVVIDTHIILPEGTPQTQTVLRAAGYEVTAVAMNEFMKSGGAAKCLTLAL